ncbi:MAG: hypothetical protein QG622_1127 [Actinomycetota bacterium]|nr:hypothetical protein [Actinomycetota bacterium]
MVLVMGRHSAACAQVPAQVPARDGGLGRDDPVSSCFAMRILHISDCYLPRLGGIETQVHDLARRQRAVGHDVEVITATPRARHDRTAHEVIDGVPLHRTTADLPFELPVHPRPGREVRGVLAARGRFDVVHLHAGVVSPFVFGALPTVVDAGLPLVITVHSLWGPAAPAFRVLDAVGRWSRWPVVFTAVSEVAAEPLRRIVGPGVPVGVLPNGIDETVWRPEPLPRDTDDVVIVAVMRLAPRKRPMPLLRILRTVRQRVPADVRLRAMIVGNGPELGGMERWLSRRGMDGWVELTGRLDREALRDVYRRADVFVAPARLESFGIAALEARTAGLPVVAMAGAGIREFVRPGVEGFLADDDAGMASSLTRLVVDPSLRAGISAHNRQVLPEMTWPRVLRRCDEFYELAGSHPGLRGHS